jgi:hypothetical protein
MATYRQVDKTITPTPAQGAGGLTMLVESIRKLHPRGVDGLLIGQATVSGHRFGKARNGSSVVLVGMPMAALQKVDTPNSPDLQLLKGAVKPNGTIGVLMGNGSVRVVHGPAGIYLNYEEISWT